MGMDGASQLWETKSTLQVPWVAYGLLVTCDV